MNKGIRWVNTCLSHRFVSIYSRLAMHDLQFAIYITQYNPQVYYNKSTIWLSVNDVLAPSPKPNVPYMDRQFCVYFSNDFPFHRNCISVAKFWLTQYIFTVHSKVRQKARPGFNLIYAVANTQFALSVTAWLLGSHSRHNQLYVIAYGICWFRFPIRID